MISTRTTPLVAIESEILSRLFAPTQPFLSKAAAKEILDVKFPAADVRRMKQLSARARQGKLTPLEEEEAGIYERIGSLLGVLQSKARVSLRKLPRRTRQ